MKENFEKLSILQKIGLFLGGFLILYMVFNNNSNNVSQSKLQKITKQTNITSEQKISATEITKNENVYTLIKSLEKKIKDMENNKKNNTTFTSVDLSNKVLGMQQLSEIYFKNRIQLTDGSLIKRIENGMEQITFDGIKSQTLNVIPINIKNGYYLKLLNRNIEYFVSINNKKIINLYEINNSGLKKILNESAKENIRNIIYNNDNTTKENIFLKRYSNTLILFSTKNLEIINEIKYEKEIKKNIKFKKYKNIKKEIYLNGLLEMDFTALKVENGNVIQDQVRFPKGNYKLKYIEYLTNDNKSIKSNILLLKNNIIYKEYNPSEIKNVNIISYRDIKNKKEYFSKNNKVYTPIFGKNTLKLIAPGFIKGSFDKTGKLTNIEIILEKEIVKSSNLKQYIGMTLKGDTNNYTVFKDILKSETTEYDMKEMVLDSDGMLFKGEVFIDKINEIAKNTKTGIELQTKNYIINISKKNSYKIFDINTKKRLFQVKDIKIELNYHDKKVKCLTKDKMILNKDEHTINGIIYRNVEEKTDKYIFYDSKGKIIFKLYKSFTIAFDEKIEKIKLIKGEVFDYNFKIKQKTGEIVSNKIGKLLIEYQDDLPFNVFKKTKKREIQSFKEERLEVEDVLSIEKLFEINNYLKNIEFITDLDKRIKINSFRTLLIDKKIYNSEEMFYHIKKNIIEVSLKIKDLSSTQQKEFGVKNIKGDTAQLFFNISEIKNLNENYYDRKNNKYLFVFNKDKKIYKYRNKNGKWTYDLIFEEEIDIKNNVIKLYSKSNKVYKLDLNEIKKLNQNYISYLEETYQKYLNKREQDILAGKKVEEDEGKEDYIITNDDKQMILLYNKLKEKMLITNKLDEKYFQADLDINIDEYIVTPEEEEELQLQQDEENNFVFEIGTIFKYKINEMMKIIEGEKIKIKTKLLNTHFKDINGHELTLVEPSLILEVEGDISLQEVYPKPVKIIYKDYETHKKKVIEIPSSATKVRYKINPQDDMFVSGIPAFYINQKLSTMGTKITLKTISSIIKNMTTKDPMAGAGDALSGLAGGQDTGTQDNKLEVADAAMVATGETFDEVLKTIEEAVSKKKNLLIVEGGIKVESEFLEEVEVETTNN